MSEGSASFASVRTLLDGDLEQYFAGAGDSPDALWFFIHIPKTAGSSLRHELATRLQPEAHVHADDGDPARTYDERIQASMAAFVDRQRSSPARFVSGHVLLPLAESILEVHSNVRFVTLLRSPADRVISDFRYQRTPQHPGHQEFIRRYPSLESYVESPHARNVMFHYFRKEGRDTPDAVIEGMERELAFVGLQEMYYLSCRVLFSLAGFPGEGPQVHERKTADVPENQLDDVDGLRPMIRALNAADCVIHEHFLGRLRSQRQALLEFLDARAPVMRP